MTLLLTDITWNGDMGKNVLYGMESFFHIHVYQLLSKFMDE